MDTLVSMKVFRHVVEVGSFVGAAERMEMSAAMASKHVMHLEQQLGARLLNRTTRRVAPTEAGREYYERLSQVLTELDEAEQVVGAASVVPQGRLRVSSLSAFGLSYVMAAVADYAAQYPQVTVDMTLSDRVVELIDEGFDVAIRASPSGLKSSSLIARQIATAHLVLCASPAYLRRHGTPKSVDDLARHNYLQYAGVSAPEIATGETLAALASVGQSDRQPSGGAARDRAARRGHRDARHRGDRRRSGRGSSRAAAGGRSAAARVADSCGLCEPAPFVG